MKKRRVQNWYEIRRRGRTWQLVGRYGGARVRRSLETPDEREAQTRAKELWKQAEELVGPKPDTIDEVARIYLESEVSIRRSASSTRQAWRNHLRHVSPVIGTQLVTEVSYQDLLGLAVKLRDKELAVLTRRNVLEGVRSMLRFAARTGRLRVDPWDSGLMPRTQRRRPRRYSDEEVARMLAVADPVDGWVLRVLLATGIRRREATLIQERDFTDLPTQRLLVHGKGGKDRDIRLFPEAVELFAQRRGQDHRPFWPLTYHEHTKLSNRVYRAGGVRPLMHRLRHTFACRWLEAGGDLKALQHYLGHSSVTTTEIYTDLEQIFVDREVTRLSACGHNNGHNQRKLK